MEIVVDTAAQAAQPTSSASDHDYSAMPTTTEEKLHHAQMYIADCKTKIASSNVFSQKIFKRFKADQVFIQAFHHMNLDLLLPMLDISHSDFIP